MACVIPEDDIATCRGEPVLNGAFGVTKAGKWVGEPSENRPVLRLIMDFRAANALHRELPGAVTSLVGPAKWQGFVLDKGEVLLQAGMTLCHPSTCLKSHMPGAGTLRSERRLPEKHSMCLGTPQRKFT